MKKIILTAVVCLMACVSSFAQYNVNYYNQYGQSIGSSSTRSTYNGASTSYYDQYGRNTGSSQYIF